jgi:SRSO17 transposase
MMATQRFDPTATEAELTTVTGWQAYLHEVAQYLRPSFARRQSWQRAVAYIEGLLSSTERKNAWQLAEVNGDATPYGIQHLLGRALWQPDQLRDALYAYVVAHLGDPDAVLVVDETGFLKKGDQSAGVARQYSGTAGKVENCQIGVFLAYASRLGQTLMDRALYLPASWTKDAGRRQRAGIAAQTGFATKPELAQAMLGRAFASGVPASWVVGDSVYGDARHLRWWLEGQEKAYVLSVSGKERVELEGGRQGSVQSVLAGLAEGAWQRLSAGLGSKGPRLYDWQCVRLSAPVVAAGWCRCLLVRRSLRAERKLTPYRVWDGHGDAGIGGGPTLVHRDVF